MTYENARREQNLLRKRTPSATPAVAEYPEREEDTSIPAINNDRDSSMHRNLLYDLSIEYALNKLLDPIKRLGKDFIKSPQVLSMINSAKELYSQYDYDGAVMKTVGAQGLISPKNTIARGLEQKLTLDKIGYDTAESNELTALTGGKSPYGNYNYIPRTLSTGFGLIGQGYGETNINYVSKGLHSSAVDMAGKSYLSSLESNMQSLAVQTPEMEAYNNLKLTEKSEQNIARYNIKGTPENVMYEDYRIHNLAGVEFDKTLGDYMMHDDILQVTDISPAYVDKRAYLDSHKSIDDVLDSNSNDADEPTQNEEQAQGEKYYEAGLKTYHGFSLDDQLVIREKLMIENTGYVEEINGVKHYRYLGADGNYIEYTPERKRILDEQYDSIIKGHNAYDIKRMEITFEHLTDETLYRRYQLYVSQRATLDPFGTSLASIPENIIGGTVDAVNLLGQCRYKNTFHFIDEENRIPINFYSDAAYGHGMATGTRSTVASNIAEDKGIIGSLLALGYSSTMSAADTVAMAVLPGKAGAAVLGASSGSDIARNSHERGASDEVAMINGIVGGVVEGFFEDIALEKFKITSDAATSPITDVKGIFNALGSNAATNAISEGLTQVASTTSDILIMGDKSNFALAKLSYENAGFTPGQAFWLSVRDSVDEVLQEGIAGAISGGELGAVATVSNYSKSIELGKNYAPLFEVDGIFNEEAYNDVLTMALKSNDKGVLDFANKLSQKSDINSTEAGILFGMLISNKIRTTAEQELQKDGTQNTSALAQSVAPNTASTEFNQLLIDNMDGVRTAAGYAELMEQYYVAGKEGKPFDSVYDSGTTNTSLEAKQAAYNAGTAERELTSKGNRGIIEIDSDTEYVQEYRTTEVDINDAVNFSNKLGTFVAHRAKSFFNKLYISEKAALKPKQLHILNKMVGHVRDILNIDDAKNPVKVVLADSSEKPSGTVAFYNAIQNVLVVDSLLGVPDRIADLQADGVLPDNKYSTLVHEFIHWLDANEYRQKYGEITPENYTSYMSYLDKRAEREVKKLEAQGFDIDGISEYAKRNNFRHNYNEVYTEYRALLILKGETK